MDPIDTLMNSCQENRKKIAVIGDAMLDLWIEGHLKTCQEGCPAFREERRLETPGGAANAARQLVHWNVDAYLISPLTWRLMDEDRRPWTEVNHELCFGCLRIPQKVRYVGADGHTLWRSDSEDRSCDMTDDNMERCRFLAMSALVSMHFDAVLISDYDKGWLTDDMIRKIVRLCNEAEVPVVADVKRDPMLYEGAVIKATEAYARKYVNDLLLLRSPTVVTRGGNYPSWPIAIGDASIVVPWGTCDPMLPPVNVKNIVGAGDCFAAHLTLALAHGIPLDDAVPLAHAAGRVYVQHTHARPPWPHEVRKDLLGAVGKVLKTGDVVPLARSLAGKRVIFTNGVFRLPHAGHAWLLEWARQQGDVLVVGINSDGSAARQRSDGAYIMPVWERLQLLAGMEAVDWIVPFAEDTPDGLMKMLCPTILVKGNDYAHQRVPGDDLVLETLFAPPGPFAAVHSTTVAESVRRS